MGSQGPGGSLSQGVQPSTFLPVISSQPSRAAPGAGLKIIENGHAIFEGFFFGYFTSIFWD